MVKPKPSPDTDSNPLCNQEIRCNFYMKVDVLKIWDRFQTRICWCLDHKENNTAMKQNMHRFCLQGEILTAKSAHSGLLVKLPQPKNFCWQDLTWL